MKDSKGAFGTLPVLKVFPCDCGGEGLVIVAEDDPWYEDIAGGPHVNIAFWGMAPYSNNRLGWKDRLRWAWKILRTGTPFNDMVCLNGATTKRFANHLLYLIDKYNNHSSKDELQPIIEENENE